MVVMKMASLNMMPCFMFILNNSSRHPKIPISDVTLFHPRIDPKSAKELEVFPREPLGKKITSLGKELVIQTVRMNASS